MYDKELVREILTQIKEASERVLRRFEAIRSVEDFTNSEAGMEKLDAICMQLIAIGESVKNLEKITSGELVARYPDIEWKKIKGMRDIISHHYFDVDAEVIFAVCKNHINPLISTISKMIREVEA
jgi:uncharacterized protein with HEPN domain